MKTPFLPSNGYGKIGRWLVASGLWARLSGAAKGVYNILAFHANDAGEAWPSITTICRENGTAKRATLRGLRELKGYRMIEPMGIQANSRGVVRYRLLFDPPTELWESVGERPTSAPPLGAKTAPSERLDQGPKGRQRTSNIGT